VPIIASKVGEFDYAIRHQENGFLSTTAQEWREILEWVAKEPARLNSISDQAHKTVQDTYLLTALESDTKEFIGEVLHA
jgi:glycosyltransferase involved in cell wall biosynthesis